MVETRHCAGEAEPADLNGQKRLAEVWDRVVQALREVVEDLEITQDELHVAAAYLSRTAYAGVMRSLLDAALSMTSVDAVDNAQNRTRSNPEGPYYLTDAPLRPDGVLFDRAPSREAETLRVHGRLLGARSGAPVPDAEIHLWQADENGIYDNNGFHLRGRIRTDDHGRYEFTTVVPADYREHDDDPVGELYAAMGRENYRAGHIHLKVFVRGAEVLTTQLYMADAPNLHNDYVLGAVSDDLIIHRERAGEQKEAVAVFDLVVMTGRETTGAS